MNKFPSHVLYTHSAHANYSILPAYICANMNAPRSISWLRQNNILYMLVGGDEVNILLFSFACTLLDKERPSGHMMGHRLRSIDGTTIICTNSTFARCVLCGRLYTLCDVYRAWMWWYGESEYGFICVNEYARSRRQRKPVALWIESIYYSWNIVVSFVCMKFNGRHTWLFFSFASRVKRKNHGHVLFSDAHKILD